MKYFGFVFWLFATLIATNLSVNCQVNRLKDAIWKQGAGTQKEYLLDNSKSRSFQEARDFCESQQRAGLPMIKSEKEQIAVFSLISYFMNTQQIWLGAINTNKVIDGKRGKQFLWLDGSELSNDVSFTNWHDGNHPYFNRDGIAMRGDSGKWINTDYGIKRRSTVCERMVKKEPIREVDKIKPVIDQQLLEALNQKVDSLNHQIVKQSETFESKLNALETVMGVLIDSNTKLKNLIGRLEERESYAKQAAETSYKLYTLLRKQDL